MVQQAPTAAIRSEQIFGFVPTGIGHAIPVAGAIVTFSPEPIALHTFRHHELA